MTSTLPAPPPSQPTAERFASPLIRALVLDAVQRVEAAGPLDDASALQQAFHGQPTRAAQVLQRAWLLGERLGLQAELARWRPVGWGVLVVLACLLALASLGTARAVLGEGRSINAVAALVSLLGLHFITLALWLLGLLLSGGGGGWSLGRLALWLTARLPLDRGPHALTLLQSVTALLSRQRLLAWLTGAIGHGIWGFAFVLMLAVLVYGLLPRALLALFSAVRWRAGTRRLAEVDMADPYVRRIVQRLDALEPPPQVLDPERPADAAVPDAAVPAPPGAPGSLAVIGFELPPEQLWPVPGLPPMPAGSAAPLRLAGSARERQGALAQLAATRPESLLLVVHAPSSPDRGTARFVREAARLSGRMALWAVSEEGSEGTADAGLARWRRWLQSEGFEAVALVNSAPLAVEWIAQDTGENHLP